jgi:hypothetical protein
VILGQQKTSPKLAGSTGVTDKPKKSSWNAEKAVRAEPVEA